MRLITKHVGFMLLLTILACSEDPRNMGAEVADNITAQPNNQEPDELAERKLIKEGHVSFETNNLNTTRKTIFDAVAKSNAFVSADREYKSHDRNSNTVIIRVPANNFDTLLKAATLGVEKFDSKEIQVKDVTEEFLDISARVKTKKELENRFLALLKQANTVTEILEIEKQLAELRSEIESVEGRLKYLENRVSYSTLTMTFYESIADHSEFGNKFKNGFRNGWDNLVWFFVLLINVWPFILLAFGLIIGIRIYRKRKQ